MGFMRLRCLFFTALLFVPIAAHTAEQSFSDVPEGREDYAAIENLRKRAVFLGRPNGTFGPDEFVNRAEAITVVVRAVANVKNIPSFTDCFPDVRTQEWYVQAVCYAKDLDWIGGYPDGTFQPERTVAKAEFLKILLNAYGIDTENIRDVQIPLSIDVADANEWYFPYMSYALATSMTRADASEKLNPGTALTRGQVALLMHRFLQYREGGRDQNLLTNAEKDIRLVFAHLDTRNIANAQFAVGRVRIAAWGAKQRLPETLVVQVTAALGDTIDLLVKAYGSVQQNDVSSGLAWAKDAYSAANDTDALNGGAMVYTDAVRSYAHNLAEQIRAFKGEDKKQ
jgi:hypothetical protein